MRAFRPEPGVKLVMQEFCMQGIPFKFMQKRYYSLQYILKSSGLAVLAFPVVHSNHGIDHRSQEFVQIVEFSAEK